jgi:catechol 2,3-dioxygenase-like lactoylglutathione lyase family enzyme
MSFRPKYLAHVNIYVRDVERSHEWYADLLGLHTYGLPARRGGLHVGGPG